MEPVNYLLGLLCGPWGPLVGGVLVILLARLGVKLPAMPTPPKPEPGPILPTPPQPASFPRLRQLLDALAALKGVKAVRPEDLPADTIAALWVEVDTLADEAAARRKAEAATLLE